MKEDQKEGARRQGNLYDAPQTRHTTVRRAAIGLISLVGSVGYWAPRPATTSRGSAQSHSPAALRRRRFVAGGKTRWSSTHWSGARQSDPAVTPHVALDRCLHSAVGKSRSVPTRSRNTLPSP